MDKKDNALKSSIEEVLNLGNGERPNRKDFGLDTEEFNARLDSKEVVYSTFCMKCENGNNYSENEYIPESCPVCGEHNEYSILELDDLTS